MRRVLAPVRVPVAPHPEDVAALERKRAALKYHPADGFHRDQVQRRLADETPALLRRQAG